MARYRNCLSMQARRVQTGTGRSAEEAVRTVTTVLSILTIVLKPQVSAANWKRVNVFLTESIRR